MIRELNDKEESQNPKGKKYEIQQDPNEESIHSGEVVQAVAISTRDFTQVDKGLQWLWLPTPSVSPSFLPPPWALQCQKAGPSCRGWGNDWWVWTSLPAEPQKGASSGSPQATCSKPYLSQGEEKTERKQRQVEMSYWRNRCIYGLKGEMENRFHLLD